MADTLDIDIDHQTQHNDTGSLLTIFKNLNIQKYFANKIFMEKGSLAQTPQVEFEKMYIDKNEKINIEPSVPDIPPMPPSGNSYRERAKKNKANPEFDTLGKSPLTPLPKDLNVRLKPVNRYVIVLNLELVKVHNWRRTIDAWANNLIRSNKIL